MADTPDKPDGNRPILTPKYSEKLERTKEDIKKGAEEIGLDKAADVIGKASSSIWKNVKSGVTNAVDKYQENAESSAYTAANYNSGAVLVNELFKLYQHFTNPLNKDLLLKELGLSFEGEETDKYNLDKAYFEDKFLKIEPVQIEYYRTEASHVLYELWDSGVINLIDEFEKWEPSYRYFFKGDLMQFECENKSKSFFNQEGILRVVTASQEKLRLLNESIDYEALEELRQQATEVTKNAATTVGEATIKGAIAAGEATKKGIDNYRLEIEKRRQEEIELEERKLQRIAEADKKEQERIAQEELALEKKRAQREKEEEAELLKRVEKTKELNVRAIPRLKEVLKLSPALQHEFIENIQSVIGSDLVKKFGLYNTFELKHDIEQFAFTVEALAILESSILFSVHKFIERGILKYEYFYDEKKRIDAFFEDPLQQLKGQLVLNNDFTFDVWRSVDDLSPAEKLICKLVHYECLLNPTPETHNSISKFLMPILVNDFNGNIKYVRGGEYKEGHKYVEELPKKLRNFPTKSDCLSALNNKFKRMAKDEIYTSHGHEAIANHFSQDHTTGIITAIPPQPTSIESNKFLRSTELQISHVFSHEQDNGFFLGTMEQTKTPIYYKGDAPLITVGQSGSGKTQCHAIENLINHQGSAIVLDVKGELYEQTAEARRKVSKVFRFCPADVRNSASYNPLNFISHDEYYFEDDCLTIAHGIMPKKPDDKYWQNDARSMLASIVGISVENTDALRPTEEEKEATNPPEPDTITGVSRLVSSNNEEMHALIRLMGASDYDLIQNSGRMIRNLLQGYGQQSTDLEAQDGDSKITASEGGAQKQLLGVVGELDTHLKMWQTTLMRKITERSDWSPLDLKTEPTTIYLCVPLEKLKSHAPVLRLMLAQHIDKLMQGETEADHQKVLLMLDEFAQLGEMPPIMNAITAGRGYGIKTWLMCQSVSQLREHYGENGAKTILNTCGVENWMRVSFDDAEMLAARLGTERQIFTDRQENILQARDITGVDFQDYILTFATGEKPLKLKKEFYYQRQAAKNS